MSYCRNNGEDSDVYVVATKMAEMDVPGWWCCGCKMEKSNQNFFFTREETIKHLLRHREKGDKVPERAFERLRKEIAAG